MSEDWVSGDRTAAGFAAMPLVLSSSALQLLA